MSELWQLSAGELATAIAAGSTTSRAVVEAHLARIDAVDGRLNAVVRRLDEEALDAADAADAAVVAGAELGPLHGVPISVKENIDLAGTPTTQGVPLFAEATARTDAPTVERMRAAGAIPIARTNMPDMGLRVHTRSTLHGLTRNPWHPGVTAGGSSGGEASAIASGMSPLGLGNDIGGSLRNPAHCCGIASIKPTLGTIPIATEIPPEDLLLAGQQMLCAGPMARRVGDVRRAFDVLVGRHVRDPRSVTAELDDLADGETLTVAVLPDPPGGDTHPEIAAAIRSAADVCADAGHRVVEATPPDYELTVEMWSRLLISDLSVQRPLLEAVVSAEALACIDILVEFWPRPSLAGSAEVQAGRFRLMRAWSAFFAEHPVVLSPTWALPAFEHDVDATEEAADRLRSTLRPVLAPNLLGLPAAVVPHGTADGLPVGVQVIGDRFSDRRCLAVAEQIERDTDPMTPIDPVT